MVAVSGSLLLGGATTFLVNLCRAFAARGLVLPVVSLTEANDHAEDFARLGQPVHCLPGSKLIYEDRLLHGYRAVARYRPRAVLACLGGESFEVLRLLPKGVARLGIVQSHEPGPYAGMRRYAPWLDAAVGVSRVVEQELAGMPELKHTRVRYIPYGIHFGTPPAPRPTRGHAPLRLVYLGRLIEEQKRVSRLVELARLIEGRKLPVEFTLIGGGPQEESLRREMSRFEWVRFTGPLPNTEVSSLLRSSDLYVLLSDYEGLPLSLLEAMGHGVVPLVSDLPSGLREAVGDDCGFRVPVGDVERAAKIIEHLVAHPEELAGRAERASRFVRLNYSADRMAGDYLEFIDSLPAAPADWLEDIEVPVPLGVNPWVFSGLMRKVRRRLKPFLRR